MSNLQAALDYKFGVRAGVRIINDVLVEYPGDMPSAEDQAKWIAEYEAAQSWSELREERNRRLAETDWWSFADSPAMTDEQTAYRQALRDLPATVPAPPVDDTEAMKSWPVWPTKP